MSITIDGYAPVYTPTPAPSEPKTDPNNGADPNAALNEAIAAAKRALEAARAAQAALEKAQKALKDNQDASKTEGLQNDVNAKQATADQRWADLKVATKSALAAGGPQGQDKATQQLKAIDSKDERWGGVVDTAKKEKPDLGIVASGNKDADAAAKRVSGAYASGGDAAAAKQLRTELEQAKTPQERSAILRSAMPVVDRVTKDLGLNSRRADADWQQEGQTYSADADNPNAIDTRGEFDHTVADLEASVDLAGDKEAAFHIAHDILQVMPGGTQGDSANNLLGLLGLDLGQSSPNKTSMLETAMSAALVQPDAKGQKDSVLAMPLAQRDQAARLLAPDRPVQLTIRDWTDDQGIKHDGTLWHEVEQNPDLLLTADQRADIDKKTQGWPADEVLKEKTSRAIDNLRQQNPGRDLDHAKCGDSFSYQPEDPRQDPLPPLAKDVQTAVDQSKGAHPDDLQYGADLDKLTGSDAFRRLGADQQAAAIGQFDRTVTQAAKGGKPLDAGQKDQLRALIGSSTFHDVNTRVQDRVLGLFSEFAKGDGAAARLNGLKQLVDHAGFRALDDETAEFQVLDAYQHDGTYRNVVDKLTARNDLAPADARTALDLLTRVKANRQLYEKSNDGDKQKILDSVLQATTDLRFRGFAQNQKDAAIDKLVKYGDEQYALDGAEGVNKALDEAAKVKPNGPTGSQATAQPTQTSTQPTTQAGLPTAESVKADLAKVEAGAHDTATSKETINDDLRRVAGDDPVTYAYLKLQREHKDDKAYLDLLTKAIPEHRRDYTTQQVKDLVAKGQPGEAMKLLRANMDATADPAERAQLWDAAGKPVFTRQYFDQQLDRILGDKTGFNHSKDLGKLFSDVGQNAPPEAANLLLDAAKARTDKGHDDPLWQALLADADVGGEAYNGLSQLIETADSLGAHRADEFAAFYVRAINDAASDPKTASQVLGLTVGNAGLYQQVNKSIGDHGAAKLSVALYNAVKDRKGDPQDRSERVEANVRNQIRDGVKTFRDNAKGDVEDWQKQNKNALRLVQDFGSLDPKQVAQAIVNDRKSHPEKYFHLDDKGNPTGIDAAQLQMEQRGVQLDGLMRDLTGLKIDFEHPTVPAEKMLGDTIRDLDGDEVAMSTLNNNVSLDTHRVNQLNFGDFDGNAGPWNPTAVVGAQRDYLDKLARDYHLTPEQVQQANSRTDQWEKDLKAELAKGDKASDDTLRALTNAYQQDLRGLLKDKMPPGQDQVLVKPTDDTVTTIKTTLQSIGTTTSTTRLTMNWYKGTGDALINAYTQVTLRRGMNNPILHDPSSKLVGNAAWLGFTDKASVKKAFDFMQKWQAKIDEKAMANKGVLTDADRATLMAEYKKELPTFGEPASTAAKAGPESLRAAERFTRLLGAACFFGSSINNARNAGNEQGVTSSDAFAAFFMAGGMADTYRAVRGVSFQGGGLTDALNKAFGPQLAKIGPGAADDLAKFIKGGSVGSLLTLADMEWAYEDFTGHTLTGNTTGSPDATAGLLTTGIVAGDLLDMGAVALRTQVGGALLRLALSEGAALAVEGSIPVIGWIGAGVTAVFLGARFAYGVSKAKNEFEYDDNHDYADMVKSLGFSDDQARELMNENGGASDVKVDDWEWFVPGWNVWQSAHSTYGAAESFFTEGGMSPMHVLNPLFDANGVPQQQRLQYLQSLTPDEIKKLVGQTHKILDDEMKDDGTITDDSTAGLEHWMRDNQLWKNEYLGAA